MLNTASLPENSPSSVWTHRSRRFKSIYKNCHSECLLLKKDAPINSHHSILPLPPCKISRKKIPAVFKEHALLNVCEKASVIVIPRCSFFSEKRYVAINFCSGYNGRTHPNRMMHVSHLQDWFQWLCCFFDGEMTGVAVQLLWVCHYIGGCGRCNWYLIIISCNASWEVCLWPL